MTDQDPPPPVPLPPPIVPGIELNLEPPPALPAPRTRIWLRRDVIEMFVVFVIAVMPPLLDGLVYYATTAPPGGEYFRDPLLHLRLVQRSIIVSVPVLYLMWRSRMGWVFFGLGDRPRVLDALIGVGVLLFDYAIWYAIQFEMRWVLAWQPVALAPRPPVLPIAGGVMASVSPAHGLWWIGPMVLGAAFNGFAEEIVMRAYFIPRLERAMKSTLWAVALTSLAFGAYHLYQGVWAALFGVITGVILGFVFVQTRRLWPVFFAHMLMDIAPFLLGA